MDGLVGGAGQAFLKEGLLGAIIVVLGIVAWVLVKRNDALQAKLDAIQEKRIETAQEDARTSARVIESNTTAMSGVKQSIDALALVVRETRRHDA